MGNDKYFYYKWLSYVKKKIKYKNIKIESIGPSVWFDNHIQVVYEKDNKRFCISIPKKGE